MNLPMIPLSGTAAVETIQTDVQPLGIILSNPSTTANDID